MRKSRISMRKEYKNKSIRWFIAFGLILPILSITLGHLGSKYLIIPHFFSKKIINEKSISKDQPNTDVNSIREIATLELIGFDIYSIQVGNFSTKENADYLVKELNDKGMGSYIWKNNGYKVITISMLDRQLIDQMLPKVIEEYKQAFVAKISVPPKKLKYLKKDYEYSLFIKKENGKLLETYKEISDDIVQLKTSSYDQNKYDMKIKDYINNLKDSIKELKKAPPSSGMESTHTQLLKIVESFKADLEAAQQYKNQEKTLKIQNALMDSLYHYLNFSTEN